MRSCPVRCARVRAPVHFFACAAAVVALSIAVAIPLRATAERPDVVLDGDAWVVFYDIPSRRFRHILDGVVRRDLAAVQRDLETTIAFLDIETERATAELQAPLREVIDSLRDGLDAADLSRLDTTTLEATFARTHWLLAQHYLVSALALSDEGQARSSALHITATAHHLERAILWSGMPVTRAIASRFDALREVAATQRSSEPSSTLRSRRPVREATRLLIDVGNYLDRKPRIGSRLEGRLAGPGKDRTDPR